MRVGVNATDYAMAGMRKTSFVDYRLTLRNSVAFDNASWLGILFLWSSIAWHEHSNTHTHTLAVTLPRLYFVIYLNTTFYRPRSIQSAFSFCLPLSVLAFLFVFVKGRHVWIHAITIIVWLNADIHTNKIRFTSLQPIGHFDCIFQHHNGWAWIVRPR